MCLSAPVSFSAAAVLIPAGAYTMRQAARIDRRYLALAALPLFLGLQQLAEGVTWVAGARGDLGTVAISSRLYMFFAWIGWPVWIPVSVYFTEPARRRSAYMVFAIAGGMLGAVQFAPYLTHPGWLETTLLPRAIRYSDIQLLDTVVGRPAVYVAYVTLLLAPLFLATDRRIKVFGGLVALALAVTLGFFQWAYISVFCFGGAVASAYLLWALRRPGPGLAVA
jgi:hypothetical protein